MLISKIENLVLPQGWSSCCLPDFTDIVMGQSPTSDTYNKSGSGIPFFQGKAEFGAIYPTVAKYCSAPNKIALAGATLLSVRAPVGPTNLAKEKCCIGRGLAAIHPAGGISPMFILFLLRSIETDLSKEGTGSTFSAINKQFVEELEFGLPPLPEQHRIVAKIEELFSELDKGIENLKTAQAQLKVYRQALLKHAFEGKLTVQWRAENQDKLETAAALLARIQAEREQRYQQQLTDWQTNGGSLVQRAGKPKVPKPLPPLTAEELAELPELPEGWGWVKLGDLASKITDGEHFKPAVKTEGVYFLSAKDVKHNGVSFEAPLFIDEETAEKARSRCDPERNDILIVSRGATVGRMCIVNTDKCFCLLGSVILVKATAAIQSRYFLSALKSPLVNTKIVGVSGATAQQAIYLRDIQHVPVPVCSSLEQSRIVEELEANLSEVDQLELTLITSLQQSEALRQSILKRAFSGQLVPQDPHDEPAAALLARIRAERVANQATAKPSRVRIRI